MSGWRGMADTARGGDRASFFLDLGAMRHGPATPGTALAERACAVTSGREVTPWASETRSSLARGPGVRRGACPTGDLLAAWYTCRREPGRELGILASRLRYGQTEWEPAAPFWDTPDRNDHATAFWYDGDRTKRPWHESGRANV